MSDFEMKALVHNDGEMARALRSLPARVPPPGLTTSLRVLASRERQRAAQRRSLQKFFETSVERLRLTIHNMMRPFAVPFAGGVFSAVALFSIWVVPAYPVRGDKLTVDVPTALSTAAQVKGTSAIGVTGADVVVEIVVDDQGRMVDYTIVEGNTVLMNTSLRRNLENRLLFTKFEPATAFGVPTRGTIRLFFNSSRIDVKG